MVTTSQPAQGTAVARRDTSDVGVFQQQLQSRARQIQAALPAHITPDKFQRTVLTAVAQNPELLKADRESLVLACYKAAQDALLPDGREAALVVFSTWKKINGRFQKLKLVQYMPMVYGLRKKILQSGDVVALEVGVVYAIEAQNGYFRYEVGTEPPLNHAPMLDIPEEEATDDKIIAAYSIATMKDGTKSYEVMRRSEINKVRQMSQTGALGQTAKFDDERNGIKKGDPLPPKGPWVDWFAEMAKKTVMRRHAKTLPMSGDILIDVEGRELERSASTAFALGQEEPDEPELLTDESGATIDGSTGEVLDEGNGAADEGTASSEERPSDETENGSTASGATATGPASQSDSGELFSGEPDPMVTVAEELIVAFGTANNVGALKRLYDEAQLDIAGMRDETAKTVEDAYERNLKRFGTTRAKVAKVVAEAAAATKQTEPAK